MDRAMPPKLREVKRWTNGGSKARMTALLARKWTLRSHIEEMEKLIVLAVLTALSCSQPPMRCKLGASIANGAVVSLIVSG
jgi:hypothetical protein